MLILRFAILGSRSYFSKTPVPSVEVGEDIILKRLNILLKTFHEGGSKFGYLGYL
jgi:hypothetical protein